MKNKKLLSAAMAATMLMGTAMPVFAATENDTNSIGSVAEDITNVDKVGYDKVQNQKSEYSDEITADANTNTCEAYLTKASTFSVVIPKTIVLDGAAKTNNTGVYSVTVKGNIAGDDIISVVPETNSKVVSKQGNSLDDTKVQFYLGQPGKKDIVATVTQPKTTFQINDGMVTEENVETGNTVTGTVAVSQITAGKWSGNFNFKIAINTDEAILTN